MAAGEISPVEAQEVAGVLELHRRALDTSDLAARVAALEAAQPHRSTNMPGDLRRRVERLECATGVSGDILPRIFIPPPGCPDVPAWERACDAEAARDGVRPLIVRFVKPGDVVAAGVVVH